MVNSFKGKVAVVTGAGSGIGRACAVAFAAEGAQVVVADIAPSGGAETVRLIEAAHGEALFVACDVARSADVQALMAATVKAYGRLDFACNNAGIGGPALTTGDYAEADWRKVIDVNLTGAWLCMKYELPLLLKQGRGAIVNMALLPRPRMWLRNMA